MVGKGVGLFSVLMVISLCYELTFAAELMSTLCKNGVVSVGARKGEVLAKCGTPINKSQDTVTEGYYEARKKKDKDKRVSVRKKVRKEREEAWTYIIDGSYRFFIFQEGKLARIEAGGLAR